MIIRKNSAAFTLIELLVVISIIAILAGIALPVFSQVQIKGAQTKALSNAKQIGLALKVYAGDNNGIFPSYDLDSKTLQPASPTPVVVSNSNNAFAQLLPQYLTNESIFWVAKATECAAKPNGPDNLIDNPLVYPPTKTLVAGENHWAYVAGLNDTSNSQFPLIADAFNDAKGHKYSTNENQEGGLWKGTRAIVIRVDISGTVEKVDPTTLTVLGAPTAGGTQTDLFDTSGNAKDWMSAPAAGSTSGQTVVNPL